MKKIAIIIPYFGKIPPIFEAWLISAESNKNIDFIIAICDFIIFTDDISIKKYKVTDNIKIYIESFDDFKQRFQEKINFKISLDYPYKLCDYRPMYGLVLSDLLKEYDFWGFGDLSQYITNDVLNSFDRIFNYGALSLYKHEEKTKGYEAVKFSLQSGTLFKNTLFNQIGYFKEKLFIEGVDLEYFSQIAIIN
ncbi:DUF6625 family protein [Lactobacillus helveticus]|uniref:DUF6625 family protein n=1 Tax=Lactobacillus helveticus TaxID=1587 RepID=UPI0015620DB9|nr:DUF6625 family protein [Lactobacillus helveticus]NRO27084.1 hypothetical protein [Lactobacillus helveticus]